MALRQNTKKFIDHVSIEVKAGNGGPGCTSFRREKYIPKGGPDGGDGGAGGNVIFQPNHNLQTLMDLRLKRLYKAKNGDLGRGKNQSGKDGQDCIVAVPIGTMITDEDGAFVADLVDESDWTVAHGGKGGRGNAKFATSINRTPRYSQPGLPGEEKKLFLELRLIAEVGFVGLPNAGKSTLLQQLTRAKPKIASYPFTTLFPNLGVLSKFDREIVIADIPGLVEGASEGIGLGHDFLRHIDRTRFLVHLVEAVPDDVERTYLNYQTICDELTCSEFDLNSKACIVVINKVDQIKEEDIACYVEEFKKHGVDALPISALVGVNMDELVGLIYDAITKEEEE